MNFRKNKYFKGFSVIEIMVVVVIIGILATVIFVSYGGIQSKARDTTILSDIDAMDALQTSYGLKNGVAGKAYYSGSGVDLDLDFTPSDGNVIDVVINGSDYCIRGYNVNSKTNNSIDTALFKESTSGICATLEPSGVSRGIETVTIGDQVWMKDNLNVGGMIPAASNYTDEGVGSQVIQKHCMGDDITYCNTYGGQYSWYEATNYPLWYESEGVQGICPVGFHIPTLTEFNALATELGGASIAGGKMKEIGTSHWQSPNITSSDSGFNALPAGYADNENFYQYQTDAFFWTSTYGPPFATEAYYKTIWSGSEGLGGYYGTKSSSMSIRCIQG